MPAQDLHDWQFEEVKKSPDGARGGRGMPRRSRKWRLSLWLEEEESEDRHEVMFAGQSPRAATLLHSAVAVLVQSFSSPLEEATRRARQPPTRFDFEKLC